MAKKGRPARDTVRVYGRVGMKLWGILAEDAGAKGYLNSSGGVLWGEYLEAIAVGILTGKIKVPQKTKEGG